MAADDDDEALSARLSDPPAFVVDFALAFQIERLARLHAAWRERCGAAGALPKRADFDPLTLREHLGWLSVLEVLPDRSDVIIRLSGTKIAEMTGRDNTGLTSTQASLPSAARLFRFLIDHPRPVRTHGRVSWIGKDYVRLETLVLPLADDGRTVDRFLVGVSMEYGG